MLKVKKLHPDAKVIYKEGNDFLNICALNDVLLPIHKGNEEMLEFAHLPINTMKKIDIGIEFIIPSTYKVFLEIDSNLGSKGVRAFYFFKDHVLSLYLQNLGKDELVIKKGDNVVSLYLLKIEKLIIKIEEIKNEK